VRIRLLTKLQLRAIQDNGLHEEMAGNCVDEVRRALDAVGHLHEGIQEGHLNDVVRALAASLRTMPKLCAAVAEAVELGGAFADEESYFEAMAVWVVDNQLGEHLTWNAYIAVARRRFSWLPGRRR
jgi:hypothetical protein